MIKANRIVIFFILVKVLQVVFRKDTNYIT
jgi:hypothetical protein